MDKFKEICTAVGLLFIMGCYTKFWMWLSSLAHVYLDGWLLEIVKVAIYILPIAIFVLLLVLAELHHEKKENEKWRT